MTGEEERLRVLRVAIPNCADSSMCVLWGWGGEGGVGVGVGGVCVSSTPNLQEINEPANARLHEMDNMRVHLRRHPRNDEPQEWSSLTCASGRQTLDEIQRFDTPSTTRFEPHHNQLTPAARGICSLCPPAPSPELHRAL